MPTRTRYNERSLFSILEWHRFLESKNQQSDDEIDTISSSLLLDKSTDDLVDSLMKKYQIEVPVIDELNPDIRHCETEIDVSQDRHRMVIDRNRSSTVVGTSIKFIFKFSGDCSVFDVKLTSASLNPPRAAVNENQLILTITGANLASESVRQEIDDRIAKIKSGLEQHRLDSKSFNDQLRARIRNSIEQRKEKLHSDQKLVAELKLAFQSNNDSTR